MIRTCLVLGAAWFFMGCGSSTPVPADKLARAQSAVRSAEENNADANASAALHLKLAREQLAQARRMMEKGDNERAQYVLLRAESDADAALNIARETNARMEAQRTVSHVQQIKMQMQQQLQMQQQQGGGM